MASFEAKRSSKRGAPTWREWYGRNQVVSLLEDLWELHANENRAKGKKWMPHPGRPRHKASPAPKRSGRPPSRTT